MNEAKQAAIVGIVGVSLMLALMLGVYVTANDDERYAKVENSEEISAAEKNSMTPLVAPLLILVTVVASSSRRE